MQVRVCVGCRRIIYIACASSGIEGSLLNACVFCPVSAGRRVLHVPASARTLRQTQLGSPCQYRACGRRQPSPTKVVSMPAAAAAASPAEKSTGDRELLAAHKAHVAQVLQALRVEMQALGAIRRRCAGSRRNHRHQPEASAPCAMGTHACSSQWTPSRGATHTGGALWFGDCGAYDSWRERCCALSQGGSDIAWTCGVARSLVVRGAFM